MPQVLTTDQKVGGSSPSERAIQIRFSDSLSGNRGSRPQR